MMTEEMGRDAPMSLSADFLSLPSPRSSDKRETERAHQAPPSFSFS